MFDKFPRVLEEHCIVMEARQGTDHINYFGRQISRQPQEALVGGDNPHFTRQAQEQTAVLEGVEGQ